MMIVIRETFVLRRERESRTTGTRIVARAEQGVSADLVSSGLWNRGPPRRSYFFVLYPNFWPPMVASYIKPPLATVKTAMPLWYLPVVLA